MKYLASPIIHRLYQRFSRLYGAERASLCAERLAMMVGRYGVGAKVHRPAGLWSELDAVLITYGDTLRDPDERPLVTLRRFLNAWLRDAFSAVHILPFFPCSSDDGFSIIDYREVNPALGQWRDIQAIAEDFRLMTDLVLNHCSRESEWFRDYVAGISPARGYFIGVPDGADLCAVVRPRPSPVATEVMTRRGMRRVWTTFSADQVDLNFANPDVLFEFLDILFFHISQGARIIRLDAIAYLWKTIGTPCIHLPETHEIVRLFRDVLELVAPDVVLITETNVPHEENVRYFGAGDEAHMVYQFALPPLVLHALLKGTGRRLTAWASALKPPPAGCAFLNFTASHDGIGVRPLEGLLSEEELREVIAAVTRRGGKVSTRVKPDGTESPYELNISYFSALGDADDADTERHVARFLCSQAIPLALRGVPAVYIHSLLATPNDLEGVERTGRARSINRRQLDRAGIEASLDNPESVNAQVFQSYTRMLRVRSQNAAFHPDGPQQILDLGDDLFVIQRTSPDGAQTIVAVHNMTGREREVALARHIPCLAGHAKWRDLISGRLRGRPRHRLLLAPWEVVWLTPPAAAETTPPPTPSPPAFGGP